MIKIQFEQFVEDYYYDRLDTEARAAFEARMLMDTMFADQVEHYIRGLEVMRDYRNMQLKSRFEAKENGIRRYAIMVKFARFAALILLTLAIPFTFMQYVFAKKNLANKKAATHQEIIANSEISNSEALVQWIVDSVADKSESSNYSDILTTNYEWNTNMDFSVLEDLYHYTVNRVSHPFPDISPELANRFMEILDSDGEYVTNLLAEMAKEIENQENTNNN